jgi:hypothetical protein
METACEPGVGYEGAESMGTGGRVEYPAKARTALGSPTQAHSAGMLRNRRVV